MSDSSRHQPDSELGKQLLAAAEEESPSEQALERAMAGATTEAAKEPKSTDSAAFALDALTAEAVPEPGQPLNAEEEDSGLIDLKAIAASGSNKGDLFGEVPLDSGMFPLGAPQPKSAPLPPPELTAAGPAQGNRLVYGGLAAVVVALGAVVVFLLVRDSGEERPVSAPVVTVIKTVEVPATSPKVAEGDPAASASASGSAAAAVAQRGPVGKTPAKATKPGAAGKGKGSTPAKSKCGCAPDDLMCAMRCAQK